MNRLLLCILVAFMLIACDGNITSKPPESKASADTSTEDTETVSAPAGSSQITPPGNETEEITQASDADDSDDIKLNITIGDTVLTATMEDNSSVKALLELLADKPLTINMRDYGNMEKVGGIGTDLPRNDEQITTEPGDLILFQGNSLVIYYAPNSWNFTRLGKIDGITKDELTDILGNGDVTVTLSL